MAASKHFRRLGVGVTSACPDINIVNKLVFSEAGGLQDMLWFHHQHLQAKVRRSTTFLMDAGLSSDLLAEYGDAGPA